MRNDVSIETYERLFAESGGLCAKPGCGTVLFEPSSGFAGEAVAVAGTSGEGREFARENPGSAENLVLLCPACGGEAGSGSLAPGELMRWKRELDARPSAEIPGELRRALRDRETERRADAIGKFRFFPGFDAPRRAAELAGRILEGDLAGGSAAARSRALGVCARAAFPGGDPREARRWVEAARELEPSGDVEIPAAFVLCLEGGAGDALRALVDMDSPAARSAALETEFRRGAERAVAWAGRAGLDAGDFDSDGRYLLLRSQLDLGRWDSAPVIAGGISERDLERTPALHFEIALALLLPAVPEELRGLLRGRPPFYSEEFHLEKGADEDLRGALGHFENAGSLAREAGCFGLEKKCERYALWLATGPGGDSRRLAERLRGPRPALHLVPLAVRRGIDVDPAAVLRETEFRAALSGEIPRDAACARLALVFSNLVPGAGATAMPPRAKLCERAGELLRELRAEGLSDAAFAELSALVASARGGDAEEGDGTDPLFGSSRLAERLEAEGRWEELVEPAREFFERGRSVAAAERFARALGRAGEHERLVEFAGDNGELLEKSEELRKLCLRALYLRGELPELRAELEKDGAGADDPESRDMKIRLAVCSGDDGELSAASADEYLPRASACAGELSALAEICGRLGLPGAGEISSAARDAVFAFRAAASDAGWEDDPRFRELSVSAAKLGELPLGPSCFGEGGEPAGRARSEVARGLLRGDAPVFHAARFLGKSLFELALFPAFSNLSEKDPLRKIPMPDPGFSRPPEAVPADAVAGFDATALVTLGFLGLEDRALSAFGEARVPRSTLEWLFEERRRVDFHARGAAKDAAALLELLEDGALEVLDRGPDSAGCPSAEPEADFAALAAEAKRRGDGVVVRAAPPARGDGFLAGESEDVSRCAGLIVGCAPVVRKLREKGCLSAAAERGALDRLGLFETPLPEETPIEDGASLYLDPAAAAILARLGILGDIRSAGLSAAVSRETVSRARAAVRREELSGEVVGVAKRLRLALGSRIRSGRIKTVASPAAGGSPFGHSPAALLALSDVCDAVATDDGFFIRKGRVGEGGSSARAFSTLDVLETLVSSGSVADRERREMLARLGGAGYPLPSDVG